MRILQEQLQDAPTEFIRWRTLLLETDRRWRRKQHDVQRAEVQRCERSRRRIGGSSAGRRASVNLPVLKDAREKRDDDRPGAAQSSPSREATRARRDRCARGSTCCALRFASALPGTPCELSARLTELRGSSRGEGVRASPLTTTRQKRSRRKSYWLQPRLQ